MIDFQKSLESGCHHLQIVSLSNYMSPKQLIVTLRHWFKKN